MDKGKARELPSEADREQDSPLSYNQLVSGIIDFLEVAFHTILCLRVVYPFEVFARRKKYSHVCYQSRHPGLTEYISRVLIAIRREIERSKVSKVILVIRPATAAGPVGTSASDRSASQGSETQHAYERFVFGLDYIIPASLIDLRNRDLAISNNVTSTELELIFRGFLQKIMVIDGILYDIPPSCSTNTEDGRQAEEDELTFAILLEMNDEADAPQGAGSEEPETGDWIPADQQSSDRPQNMTSSDIQTESIERGPRPRIRPIKSLDSGVINLMLFVEENLEGKSGNLRAAHRTTQKAAGQKEAPENEHDLLLARATQIKSGKRATTKSRELKNRAKRLDAERDLDQPVIRDDDDDMDLLHARASKKKRKATNARMILGETRAAESESESDSDNLDSGNSQSIRDGAGSDMDVY